MKTVILALATVLSTGLVSGLAQARPSLPAPGTPYCVVNKENPKIKGQYDQKVFQGVVFANGRQYEHFVLNAAGELIRPSADGTFTPDEAVRASSGLMISLGLSLEEKAMTIGVSDFANSQISTMRVAAIGSIENGYLHLLDNQARLMVTCMRYPQSK